MGKVVGKVLDSGTTDESFFGAMGTDPGELGLPPGTGIRERKKY